MTFSDFVKCFISFSIPHRARGRPPGLPGLLLLLGSGHLQQDGHLGVGFGVGVEGCGGGFTGRPGTRLKEGGREWGRGLRNAPFWGPFEKISLSTAGATFCITRIVMCICFKLSLKVNKITLWNFLRSFTYICYLVRTRPFTYG